MAYPILINKSAPFLERVSNLFRRRNIQTRVVFTETYLDNQCVKILKKNYSNGLEKTDAVMERGYLPLHHGMNNEMFERLHDTIDNFIKKFDVVLELLLNQKVQHYEIYFPKLKFSKLLIIEGF